MDKPQLRLIVASTAPGLSYGETDRFATRWPSNRYVGQLIKTVLPREFDLHIIDLHRISAFSPSKLPSHCTAADALIVFSSTHSLPYAVYLGARFRMPVISYCTWHSNLFTDLRRLSRNDVANALANWRYVKSLLLSLPLSLRFSLMFLRASCIRGLITPTESMRQDLLSHGMCDKPVRTISIGIDFSEACFDPVRLATQSFSYEVPVDRDIISYAGPLTLMRGIDTLIEAGARLLAKNRNVHLLFLFREVWSARDQRVFNDLISNKGLENRVTVVHGKLPLNEFMASLLFRSKIVALPMKLSQASIVPHITAIEAMALGRSVVTTPINGMDEIIRDGETGRLIRPGDVDGLTQAIDDLLANKDYAIQMGISARHHISQNVNFTQFASNFVSSIHEMLAPEK